MGLLSLTPLLTGAAKEVYTWQEQAQQKEDIYNENLAKAVNNVNEITQDLGNKYDDAVRLSNLVGGGSFANYLMDAESLDRLSNIYNLSGDDRDEELLNLKKKFDAMDSSKYEELDFTQTAKQKLEKETQAVRTEQIGAVGKAPTPTSKFEGFITQGVRRGGEQIREDIMTGITPPQPTAEYRPQEGAFVGATSGLTLKQKSANIDYFYNTLQSEVEDMAGRLTGEYKPNVGQESIVAQITSQADTLLQNGFQGTQDEAIAEVIQKANNPDYNLPLLTQATENSPIANSMRQVYDSAKMANNREDMQDAIDELRNVGLEDIANSLQQDFDSYVKSITDDTVEVKSVEVKDIPATKLEQKGKAVTVTTADFVSEEDKLRNSQTPVTEEFIQQVMSKNNADRDRAIDILRLYGYTQFPEKPIKQNVNPRLR